MTCRQNTPVLSFGVSSAKSIEAVEHNLGQKLGLKETSDRGDESGRWQMAGEPRHRSDTRSDRDRVTAEDLGQVSALTGRGCGYSTLHDRVHQARHFFSQFLIV